MTSKFPIKKNVPIPSFPNKYPWEALEIGDSFFVNGKRATLLSSAKGHTERKTGRKFTTRSVEGGCRVWRVE